MKTNAILFLFGVAAAAQIVSCIPPMRVRLRYATKLVLMPLLALWFLFATDPTPRLIFWGLLCGFFGDLLLLAANRKSFLFVLGSTCFAVGHGLYAAYFLCHLVGAPGVFLIVAAALCYGAYVFFFMRLLRPGMKQPLFACATAYMCVISMMSLSALLFAATNGSVWHWVIFGASLLFLFSDSCLSYDRFYRKIHFRYIIVMATYILAQAGIAFGVFMTLGGI